VGEIDACSSGLLVSQAPKIMTSIPTAECASSGSLLNEVPRIASTTGVKLVGIMLRSVKLIFERVAKKKIPSPFQRYPTR